MFKQFVFAALAVSASVAIADAAHAGFFGRRGGCSGGNCGVVVSGCPGGNCYVAPAAAHEEHAAAAPARETVTPAAPVAKRETSSDSEATVAQEPSRSVYQPVRYRRGLFRRWR